MTESEVLAKLSEYKDAIINLKNQVKTLEESKAALNSELVSVRQELEGLKAKDQASNSQLEKDAADKAAFMSELEKVMAEADQALK